MLLGNWLRNEIFCEEVISGSLLEKTGAWVPFPEIKKWKYQKEETEGLFIYSCSTKLQPKQFENNNSREGRTQSFLFLAVFINMTFNATLPIDGRLMFSMRPNLPIQLDDSKPHHMAAACCSHHSTGIDRWKEFQAIKQGYQCIRWIGKLRY